ncbi:hypothetical protein KY331_01375 [Candidatus Woesearchaeota archaeon]|nr:hypothetical protein [Candidatus Woesearchaeota archaeon]
MKKQQIILTIIFIASILFRLYFAFQTPYFDYDSYLSLRQIEHIKQTGLPIFNDDLSYSGRSFIFIPTFHYIFAFFSLAIPTAIVTKLLPNIFASTIIFITYLISKKITNNTNISLFVSFISAFIPIFVSQTINNVSVYSITIPLIFLAIYSFINLKNSTNYFLFTILLLALLHSSAFLLILGLLFYTAFIRLSKLKQTQAEVEVILFSTFLVLLLQFLVFKSAFIMHSLAVIWQNIPPTVLFQHFQGINIIEAILKIGLFPLIFGAYVIYRHIFREKNREVYILIGLATSTFVLLWLRLVQPDICLAIIGITLTLLFATFYRHVLKYLKKTRLAVLTPIISILFFLLFLTTSIIPAIAFSQKAIENSPSKEEISALYWLKRNSKSHQAILAAPTEGHLINYITERKNVIDTNFLLIKDSSKTINNVKLMFTSPYKVDVVKLLTKYNVDYIYFSENAQLQYNIIEIPSIKEDCFELIYNVSEIKIYENECEIEVEKYED